MEKLNIKKVIIQQLNLPLESEDFYIICNGKIVPDNEIFEIEKRYKLVPRLVGGKGGFGSMLRAIGAQIEKTTNREACRDLSGRRMRDVNNEKKLREWGEKIGEREREKLERRRLKREKMRAKGNYKFEDEKYDKQKDLIKQNMEEAMQEALSKSNEVTSAKGKDKSINTSLKRKEISFVFHSEMDGFSSDDEECIQETKDKIRKITNVSPSSKMCTITENEYNSSSSSTSQMLTQVAPDISDVIISASNTHESSMSTFTLPITNDTLNSLEMPCSFKNEDETMATQNSEKSMDIVGPSSLQRAETMEIISSDTIIMNSVDLQTMTSCNGTINMLDLTMESNSALTSGKTIVMESQNTEVNNHLNKKKVNASRNGKDAECAEDFTHEELLDLEAYENVSSLESLGLDRLKRDLTKRGLKCGGTINERAARLFLVRGLSSAEYPSNLLAKKAPK